MMTRFLIVTIVLALVVVVMLPIEGASAKQCNSDNNGKACRHDHQNSDNHHDDDSSTTTKDKTPFRLPFP